MIFKDKRQIKSILKEERFLLNTICVKTTNMPDEFI